MGYFAQHAMELLDGEQTVFETLEDSFPQAGHGSLRTLAGCFGFSGDDVEKRCRVLSGGEKARLVLAKMLYDPPNFLVLDEPTNHLDMATKEMLIEALSQFEGTMLFVSHDRHFLAALSQPRARADARGHAPVRRRLHRVRGAHRPRGARIASVRSAAAAAISAVMPALVASIHAWPQSKAWMAGTSPAMTNADSAQAGTGLAVPTGRFVHDLAADHRHQ